MTQQVNNGAWIQTQAVCSKKPTFNHYVINDKDRVLESQKRGRSLWPEWSGEASRASCFCSWLPEAGGDLICWGRSASWDTKEGAVQQEQKQTWNWKWCLDNYETYGGASFGKCSRNNWMVREKSDHKGPWMTGHILWLYPIMRALAALTRNNSWELFLK